MDEKATVNGLQRKLGLFPLTNIVIANMVGVGIFTTSGLLMKDLHSAAVMLALWIVGGLIALCGALSYGELAAMMPRAGGQYVYLREAYGPGAAFLFGWGFFGFIMCGGLAALAVTRRRKAG